MEIIAFGSFCFFLLFLLLYVKEKRHYRKVLVRLKGVLNQLKAEIKEPHQPVGLMELDEELNLLSKQLSALWQEVERQKDLLEGLLFSVSDVLFVMDEMGMIRLQNQKAKEVFGEAEGRSFLEISDLWLREAILKVRKGEEVKELKGERGFFGLKIVRLRGRGFLLVLHDLTPYRKLEEFKKELLAKVSHEIRTPLTAIRGFYEALKEELGQKGRYFEFIERNLERLTRLVEELFVLAELEKKQLSMLVEDVELKPLAEEVVQVLMEKVKAKGLELEVDIEDVKLHADPLRMFQLLYNLLDNAIRYTDKGKVSLFIYKRQTYAVIEVSDTGIGIPDKELDKIFEPFYVVDKLRSRQTGGLGLGLAIVRQIVDLHKGNLEVKSRIGEGTTFRVLLPT